MTRYTLKSAPEASRLLADAPLSTLCDFLQADHFDAVFGGKMTLNVLADADENACQVEVSGRLQQLPADRLQHIEAQARRVTAIAQPNADLLLRKLVEANPSKTLTDFASQRDEIARSLWCYVNAPLLFANAERAVQMHHYRDFKKLYEAYELENPVPITADRIDGQKLGEEIAAKLHLDDVCQVDAVDLPTADGGAPAIMIVITSAGVFSSQKAVQGRKLTTLYYRPPNEAVLVYTPMNGTIESCTPDPIVRRQMAQIFAEVSLGQDVSHKPLTWKTYDLGRFRKSLKLPIPVEMGDRIQKVCLTEVQVTLATWKQRLSLKVTADDDIEEMARKALGSVHNLSLGGMLGRVEFYVKFTPTGVTKPKTLSFTISGRNRCSLQSERDPEKRALGFKLLEEWGILTRLRNMTVDEQVDALPFLLMIYDLPEKEFSGALIVDHRQDAKQLETSGYIVRRSPEGIVLFEDDELGLHEATIVPSGGQGQTTLQPAEDVDGARVSSEDISRFSPQLDFIRQTIEGSLSALVRHGKTQVLNDHLAHLGDIEIGGQRVPAYLARGLADDKVLEKVDREIRGQNASTRGIIFVPVCARLPFLGAHVVLSISELLPEVGGGIIDGSVIETRYTAGLAGASAGATIELIKSGDGGATLYIPGKQPWPVVGEKRVQITETLVRCHLADQPIKTGDLFKDTGSGHFSQAFGDDWPIMKNTIVCSPRRGFWQICTHKTHELNSNSVSDSDEL